MVLLSVTNINGIILNLLYTGYYEPLSNMDIRAIWVPKVFVSSVIYVAAMKL